MSRRAIAVYAVVDDVVMLERRQLLKHDVSVVEGSTTETVSVMATDPAAACRQVEELSNALFMALPRFLH